ncbi:MAG TPA: hypothetical protein VHN37_01125 [Actinomycetota bacterium]|nr:hypothetical protein [Actinomycetota bacterium]
MKRKEAMRELFVEELAEVRGGTGVEEVLEKLTECGISNTAEHIQLYSTMACGEEGPC